MTLTDDELDRDWKPNGRRPQSTIARSFSQELQDIFRIENSVADLDEKVDKRKHEISTQSSELEALEARIREMEDRLRRSQQAGTAGFFRPGNPAPASGSSAAAAAAAPATETTSAPSLPVRSAQRREAPPAPLPKDDGYAQKNRSRPGTARQAAPGSGAMPPTPVASEGEYEVVDGDEDDDEEEDEDEEDEESSEEEDSEESEEEERRPAPPQQRRPPVPPPQSPRRRLA